MAYIATNHKPRAPVEARKQAHMDKDKSCIVEDYRYRNQYPKAFRREIKLIESRHKDHTHRALFIAKLQLQSYKDHTHRATKLINPNTLLKDHTHRALILRLS